MFQHANYYADSSDPIRHSRQETRKLLLILLMCNNFSASFIPDPTRSDIFLWILIDWMNSTINRLDWSRVQNPRQVRIRKNWDYCKVGSITLSCPYSCVVRIFCSYSSSGQYSQGISAEQNPSDCSLPLASQPSDLSVTSSFRYSGYVVAGLKRLKPCFLFTCHMARTSFLFKSHYFKGFKACLDYAIGLWREVEPEER